MAVQAIYLLIVAIGLTLLFIWLGRQDPPDGSGPFIDMADGA
jgi:hypothetical protein